MLARENPDVETWPWTRSITMLMSAAESRDSKMIALTAFDRGEGVSMTAKALADALVDSGKRTILLNANRARFEPDKSTDESRSASIEIDIGQTSGNGLTVIDMEAQPLESKTGQERFFASLQAASAEGTMIVMDLPPIAHAMVDRTSAWLHLGQISDLVFLVCLTGGISRPNLKSSLEFCTLNHVSVEGIILNDWKLPASGFLVDA